LGQKVGYQRIRKNANPIIMGPKKMTETTGNSMFLGYHKLSAIAMINNMEGAKSHKIIETIILKAK
jgi:hypothetical protein